MSYLTEQLTMEAFITSASAFFSEVISWLGDVIGVVTSNPVLLVMVVLMPVVGFAVGLLGRIIKL